jgi:U3 small nucleolar RNA-associated protein 20
MYLSNQFVSFKEQVESIKIDPVRRAKRTVTDYETDSYFKTSFSHWEELNISTSFSEFAIECAPLCQSLPLVLHHKKEINDLLVKYISIQDEHSLESLLE